MIRFRPHVSSGEANRTKCGGGFGQYAGEPGNHGVLLGPRKQWVLMTFLMFLPLQHAIFQHFTFINIFRTLQEEFFLYLDIFINFIDHLFCCKTAATLNVKCTNAHLTRTSRSPSRPVFICRFSRRGELRGGPAYRHHYGTGHVEQPPLQVLQDQHDPQAPLHHRRAARYCFQISVFYIDEISGSTSAKTDQHSDPIQEFKRI